MQCSERRASVAGEDSRGTGNLSQFARVIPRGAITLILALVSVASGQAIADRAGEMDKELQSLTTKLQALDPGFVPDDVRATGIDGLFEVVMGSRVFYVSGDARFIVRGELVELETGSNLTQARRQSLVRRIVDAVPEERMLVYEPEEGTAEHTITVFTDTTCPYCRQLHPELLKLTRQYPVRIRYLLYPRAGPNAPAADTMRNVWCAPDPLEALTRAKSGDSVPERAEDCKAPVTEHFNLGREIGIRGTPYMLVGEHVVPGYQSAAELVTLLGLQDEPEG